ncbi:MAG: hypothetical protein FWH42_03990 [Dehalococcoidia bacterium]|nr:hypothetical protein [Dehalococcoidia bacterium]
MKIYRKNVVIVVLSAILLVGGVFMANGGVSGGLFGAVVDLSATAQFNKKIDNGNIVDLLIDCFRNARGEVEYPDDFGGMYFDNDYNLIVLTTRENVTDTSFRGNLSDFEGVLTYRYAPRSYKSLLEAQVFLQDYVDDYPIGHTSIKTSDNVLEIGLFDSQDIKSQRDIIILLQALSGNVDEAGFSFVQANIAIAVAK